MRAAGAAGSRATLASPACHDAAREHALDVMMCVVINHACPACAISSRPSDDGVAEAVGRRLVAMLGREMRARVVLACNRAAITSRQSHRSKYIAAVTSRNYGAPKRGNVSRRMLRELKDDASAARWFEVVGPG